MSTTLPPRPPQRPASAPVARRPQPGSRPQSATFRPADKIPLEDEVKPPPLYEMPWHLSTPLERQFARALGMKEGVCTLRLPNDVESCKLGGACCWRWLARAIVERLLDEPVAHMALGDAVNYARKRVKELKTVSDCRQQYLELLAKADRDELEVKELSKKVRSLETDLDGVQRLREQVIREQLAKESLLVTNDRHQATIRGLEKVVASLQSQHRALVDGDLLMLRKQNDDFESKCRRQDIAIEEFQKNAARDTADLDRARVTIDLIKKQLKPQYRRKPRGATKSPGPGGRRPASAGRARSPRSPR